MAGAGTIPNLHSSKSDHYLGRQLIKVHHTPLTNTNSICAFFFLRIIQVTCFNEMCTDQEIWRYILSVIEQAVFILLFKKSSYFKTLKARNQHLEVSSPPP